MKRNLWHDGQEWLAFGLVFVVLAWVYLPTFLYPEGWIVRPDSGATTLSMGRPLFSVFSAVSAWIGSSWGMDVVYVLRASAVVGLTLSAWCLARWLALCGHDRWTALGLAIAAMTLPPYQVVLADGTQLAFAIFFAMLGTIVFHRALERRSIAHFVGAAALFLATLLIYQQQVLVALALLAIMLLKRPGDAHAQRVAVLGGAFVTTVTACYFIGWRIAYWILWPGRVDTRYGPDAVGLPGLEQARGFLEVRLPQVANLWHVEGYPVFTWIATAVAVLAAVKFLHDLRSTWRRTIVSYLLVLGLLVGADSFRLVAHAYRSYVTATALSLIVFYSAFGGAAVLLGRRLAPAMASSLAVLGGVLAFVTVRDEIAIPNWREFEAVREAILQHPQAHSFHLIGSTKGGPGFQEFGWRNSGTDVYLDLVAVNVADDLMLKGFLAPENRELLYVSTGNVLRAAPASHPGEPKPDSVFVRLD